MARAKAAQVISGLQVRFTPGGNSIDAQLTDAVRRDLRRMVADITARAEAATNSLGVPSATRQDFAEMREMAERVTALLDHVGPRRSAPDSSVLVNGVLSRALPMLRLLAGARITIDVASSGGELFARVSDTDLERILANVVANARDAMPEGGAIGIQITRLIGHGSGVGGGSESPGFVRISISDTGSGMDASIAEYACIPYFTTRQGHRGLGLASVRHVIDAVAGRIRFTTAQPRGTAVLIDIPEVGRNVSRGMK